MLTVLQAAEVFSAAIYDSTFKWDALLTGPAYADCYVGLRLDPIHKAALIAFRGSTTESDGLKDLEAAIPVEEDELGTVAYGFFKGTKALYTTLVPLIPPDYRTIAGGHSLGAAEASDFAAYATVRFRSNPQAVPYAVVLMGSPRPGCDTLNAQLRKVPIWYSFQNRQGIIHDPVTDVPTWGEHARPLIPLHESRTPTDIFDNWGLFVEPHHHELYLRGIAKLPLPPLLA